MNILGIMGACPPDIWDGNDEAMYDENHPERFINKWMHGSGATLFIDENLVGALSEERFTRIKYDGNYPENCISELLNKANLKKSDIDHVAFVTGASLWSGTGSLFPNVATDFLKKEFENANVRVVDHHHAHACASWFTSGFDEANVLTFDHSGNVIPVKKSEGLVFSIIPEDPEDQNNQNECMVVSNLNLANDPIHPNTPYSKSFHLDNFSFALADRENGISCVHHNVWSHKKFHFGGFYSYASGLVLNIVKNVEEYSTSHHSPRERETYAGKIMGYSAWGDYNKIAEWLDDPFLIIKNDYDFPQVIENPNFQLMELYHRCNWEKSVKPEDLASWIQYIFEKYFIELIQSIPPIFKKDNLCLGGGCALNVITNSRLLEEGLFKDVHVNTAPSDDGLHFGSACFLVYEYLNKIPVIGDNLGCIGLDYNSEQIESAMNDRGIMSGEPNEIV